MAEQSKLQIADCRLQIKFGTDGWRGVIAEDFTFKNVKMVAQALADYLLSDYKLQIADYRLPSVIVGYDTRFLSEKFAETFVRVLLANGIKAKLTTNIVSTPLLSFAAKKYGFNWGVMLSASHNPGKYNGIKFRGPYGGPVNTEVTKRIENYLGKKSPHFCAHREIKGIRPLNDYFAYLRSRVNFDLLKKSRIRIIVDPLYGCAAGYLEEILKTTGISLISIHSYRDPLFGGLQPEQVEHNLRELKNTVRKNKALVGLAFDGDADRLGVVTDEGKYLTPHQVFPLLLNYLVKEKRLTGKVIQAVSLGYLSKRIAEKNNLPFEEVPVGFKHITEKMLKEDILLGGEESGGYGFGKLANRSQSKKEPTRLSDIRRTIGFSDGLPERDGVLSGLLFLEMLSSTKQKPSQLVASLEKYFGKSYFLREDLRLVKNSKILKFKDSKIPKLLNLQIFKSSNLKISKILTIDGIKIVLSDDSWLLLRPSGTEPIFRIYAESPTIKKRNKLLAFAKKIIYNFNL